MVLNAVATLYHLVLEVHTLFHSHGVGLGDQRDDVDFFVQASHELDVQRLQSGRKREVKRSEVDPSPTQLWPQSRVSNQHLDAAEKHLLDTKDKKENKELKSP